MTEDNQFRKILADTKQEAGENLKFRIMQQIETEKSLSGKRTNSSFSVLNSMLSVFGVMYAVIAVVLLTVYFLYGKDAVNSTHMYLFVILITSVCSAFWSILLFDEKRKNKKAK